MTFKLNLHRIESECVLKMGRYMNNSNLSLGLVTTTGKLYTSITKNIEKLPKNQAAIDVYDCTWAEEFILKHKLGTNTGKELYEYHQDWAGHCTYPVYEFDMNRIKEIAEITRCDK